MSSDQQPDSESQRRQFAEQAEGKSVTLLGEVFDFLRHSKKWWLTPIILVLFVVGLFVVLAATGAAPFIYTLF